MEGARFSYVRDRITLNTMVDTEAANKGARLHAIDLCYSVVVDGKLKRIVKNVNFGLASGDMCALMGPSGAGKRYEH